MGRVTRIEETRTIPEDATVLHYDELDDEFGRCLPSLIERAPFEETALPKSDRGDDVYVKFTDYYRISRR